MYQKKSPFFYCLFCDRYNRESVHLIFLTSLIFAPIKKTKSFLRNMSLARQFESIQLLFITKNNKF